MCNRTTKVVTGKKMKVILNGRKKMDAVRIITKWFVNHRFKNGNDANNLSTEQEDNEFSGLQKEIPDSVTKIIICIAKKMDGSYVRESIKEYFDLLNEMELDHENMLARLPFSEPGILNIINQLERLRCVTEEIVRNLMKTAGTSAIETLGGMLSNIKNKQKQVILLRTIAEMLNGIPYIDYYCTERILKPEVDTEAIRKIKNAILCNFDKDGVVYQNMSAILNVTKNKEIKK